VDYFGLALSFGEKLLGHLPNYDQKILKKFHKLKKQYIIEKKKAYPQRDDDKILSLKDELGIYLEEINMEANK